MKKVEDFLGQRMLVLPSLAVNTLKKGNHTKNLYLTDIGYFPKAKNHFRERNDGCTENILFICTDGMGWIECMGEKNQLTKNQYCIIPKDIPHKYYADHLDPWTIFWLHFNGNNAEHFISPYKYPREIPESNNARFEDRLQLFQEILIILEDFSNNNLEYSSVLLTHLLGSLKYLSQFRKVKEFQQNDTISRAIQFMKENLRRKLPLDEIASHCGVSLSHFCLLFKKNTSYTPVEYLTMLRVQKACSMLSFGVKKINEIAYEVGYDDAYYFSRIFSKTMGQSPKEYRKNKKA